MKLSVDCAYFNYLSQNGYFEPLLFSLQLKVTYDTRIPVAVAAHPLLALGLGSRTNRSVTLIWNNMLRNASFNKCFVR